MAASAPAGDLDALRQQMQELESRMAVMASAYDELRAHANRLAGHAEIAGELALALSALQEQVDVRDGLTPEEVAHRRGLRRARELMRTSLPPGAVAIVLGKAGRELVDVAERTVWPFPQSADGAYAGYDPASSLAAIAHLEALRAAGAEYVIVPEQSRWWLDFYDDFRRHLERRYRLVIDQPGTGMIVALGAQAGVETAWHTLENALQRLEAQHGRRPSLLDWDTGAELSRRLPSHAVFTPPLPGTTALPYVDASIDVVVVAGGTPALVREAERVAAHAVVTWSAGADSAADEIVNVRWKSAPEAGAALSVSIIIPCFNSVALTERCLRGLSETLPADLPVEVILADDASTDLTPAVLDAWQRKDSRIRVVRNERNVGFTRTANAGAQAASGDILVFMNNDIIPLPGWLTALLRTFQEHEDAGAVGGKLIYPDGRLQEAGGLVFSDGSAANFGRDDYDPDHPLYSFFREAHYCSGALLATRRALFHKLGGFDAMYEPAYYEDTDFCFRLRAEGYRVYFQPQSLVIHAEGGTAGLDTSVGMKRYQVLNQNKFRERWKETLRHYPARPAQWDFAARHALTAPPRRLQGVQ